MDKKVLLKRLKEIGLVAMLAGPAPGRVMSVVEALVAGGVRGIELAGTMPDAADVARAVHLRYGEALLLGVGTLMNGHQVADAAEAGAQFLATPLVDEALAAAMADTGRLVVLGAFTATEVARAQALGADVVRIFPGSAVAPSYLQALCRPFPRLPLMPDGGVRAENVGDWLAAGAVAVVADSALCPRELAEAGRFEEITARARGLVEAVAEAKKGGG